MIKKLIHLFSYQFSLNPNLKYENNMSTTTTSSTTYFQEKRQANKEAVLGIDGMDCMVFHTSYAGSRGIKGWERAQLEAEERRERQRAYRQSFQTKRHDDPTKRAQQQQHTQQQQRQQQEQQAIAQRRWEAENPFAGYQPPANGPNDAWDD
jgi:hypothetical protein